MPGYIIEDRSLMLFLDGELPDDWRVGVISEYHHSVTPMCAALGVSADDARLVLVCGRSKLMHAESGFRPMPFDTESEPEEFHDFGDDLARTEAIARLYDLLVRWGRRNAQRVARSDKDIAAMRGASACKGILPILIDGSEVPEALSKKYRGPAHQDHLPDIRWFHRSLLCSGGSISSFAVCCRTEPAPIGLRGDARGTCTRCC